MLDLPVRSEGALAEGDEIRSVHSPMALMIATVDSVVTESGSTEKVAVVMNRDVEQAKQNSSEQNVLNAPLTDVAKDTVLPSKSVVAPPQPPPPPQPNVAPAEGGTTVVPEQKQTTVLPSNPAIAPPRPPEPRKLQMEVSSAKQEPVTASPSKPVVSPLRPVEPKLQAEVKAAVIIPQQPVKASPSSSVATPPRPADIQSKDKNVRGANIRIFVPGQGPPPIPSSTRPAEPLSSAAILERPTIQPTKRVTSLTSESEIGDTDGTPTPTKRKGRAHRVFTSDGTEDDDKVIPVITPSKAQFQKAGGGSQSYDAAESPASVPSPSLSSIVSTSSSSKSPIRTAISPAVPARPLIPLPSTSTPGNKRASTSMVPSSSQSLASANSVKNRPVSSFSPTQNLSSIPRKVTIPTLTATPFASYSTDSADSGREAGQRNWKSEMDPNKVKVAGDSIVKAEENKQVRIP
jgi:hypothetical protein